MDRQAGGARYTGAQFPRYPNAYLSFGQKVLGTFFMPAIQKLLGFRAHTNINKFVKKEYSQLTQKKEHNCKNDNNMLSFTASKTGIKTKFEAKMLGEVVGLAGGFGRIFIYEVCRNLS